MVQRAPRISDTEPCYFSREGWRMNTENSHDETTDNWTSEGQERELQSLELEDS